MGLNGSCESPRSLTDARPAIYEGAGVEKSISRSSTAPFAGDLPLPVLFFRSSSKLGMAFGGVRGIVGFSIDRGVNKGASRYVSNSDTHRYQ